MRSLGSRGAMAQLLLIAFACCVVRNVGAQDGIWPKPGEDPRGTVHDTDGAPIAGATVRLVADNRLKRSFSRAIASVLATTPLPTATSAGDGSFMLLLTNAQRQLEPGYLVDFYLIVEKPGFLPWAEPLTSGLRWYLGSRVVLRRDRKDDPLRAMPWPMGAVSAPLNKCSKPWLPMPKEPSLPAANARGCLSGWPKPEPRKAKAISHTLLFTDERGKPIAGARLRFGNECYRSEMPLPSTTDTQGKAILQLAPGNYDVRCATDHHATKKVSFEVLANHPLTTIVLKAASIVDLIAVTKGGKPQPFTDISIIHHDYAATKNPSLAKLTDSQGRVRTMLGDRQGYFCYEDKLKDRKKDCGAEGTVEVRKYAQPMVVVRADELPSHGELAWFPGDNRQHGRAFEFGDCGTELVVTTLIQRSYRSFWIGSTKSPSIVVRATDLPKAPADPLMDFCLLDRRLRLRANLTIKTSDKKRMRTFRLTPAWWNGLAFGDTRGLHMFARRTADRAWQVWARDDEPYELTAWAKHHASQPVALPAEAEQPASITITFEPK